jgi:hypothetical protein
MTEVTTQPVFDRLAALRDALRAVETADAERALYQCDRLEQAVRHWHAEAIRFAAYTINHIVETRGEQFGGATDGIRQRIQELRGALADAGHTF